jgi:hypothetical protein
MKTAARDGVWPIADRHDDQAIDYEETHLRVVAAVPALRCVRLPYAKATA